jgi:AcrR family transcriptional regulator
MARKAVLSGGKRDEIIAAAAELFFEKGYEAVSVRMILDKVGGETGMFYHYFRSKEQLFDLAVERFFRDFSEKCREMISRCERPEDFIEVFLPLYTKGMQQFGMVRGSMHWSIQYAMHALTVKSMVPAVAERLAAIRSGQPQGTKLPEGIPDDILAAQLVQGISATLHSESFEAMSPEEQKDCLRSYIRSVLKAE